MTDVRGPMPLQPTEGDPSGQPTGDALPARRAAAPQLPSRLATDEALPARRTAAPQLPSRQAASHTLRPFGRHRRPVPASLPQAAPALVVAVPGTDSGNLSGVAAELAAVLSVDNPAVDVRTALIDSAGLSDPSGLRAVLDDAARRRPAGVPCAVVVPLIAAPHPKIMDRISEAIVASGVNATIGEFVNANPLLAEALHIRLADAGLARADRVRLFSIVTAADGIIVATVGGAEAIQSASITSVLLAARLALPVLTASLDGPPTVEDAAMRLKEIGATRIAVAPCVIGPEFTASSLSDLTAGAECASPLGAHSNIAKLIAAAYGNAIEMIEIPGEQA